MKIESIKKDDKINVSFEVNGTEWKGFIAKAKKSLTDNLEIKGFRKGKVPENIAKKHISPDKIRKEAMNLAVDNKWNEIYSELAKEKIISRPELLLKKITDDELLVDFSSAIYPKIKLGDISKINVKFKKSELTKEELDMQLEQLKHFFIEAKEQEKKITKKDVVNINFLGKHKGKEFEGGKAENFDLVIGSKSFVDDFEDQLIGLKKNDEKVIKVTFPKEYPEKTLAGEEVVFNVKINSVKVETELKGKELEEKLKPLGFKSKEDLINKVTEMSHEQKNQQDKDNFFKEFVKEVISLKETNIKIPEILLKQELENEFHQFAKKIEKQNMKIEQYLEMLKLSKEEFKEKNLMETVKTNIMNGLVYQELIDFYKIKANDEDFEKEYKKIAKSQGMDIEKIKNSIQKEQMENSIIYGKLIDKLAK